MRSWKKWITWVVVVCLLAGGGGAYWWYSNKDTKAAAAGPSFTESRVTKGTITQSVAGSGAVAVSESETLKVSSAATVDQVKVKEGAVVKKGTVLATFEGQDMSLSISKSKLNLQQQQMQLDQAQDKWKSLQTTGADQSDIDAAAMSIKSAQLNIEQTKLEIKDNQDKAKAPDPIVAPIDGTMTEVNVKAGDTVSPQLEAFKIVNYNKLDIEISADELDISKLKLGQKATITMDALSGESFTGVVTTIAKEGTSTNGVATFPVTVTLDKTDNVLPGMNGDVEVVIQSKTDALLVPVESVTKMGQRYFVRVPATGSTSTTGAGSGQANSGTAAGGKAPAGESQANGGAAAGGNAPAGGQGNFGAAGGNPPAGGQWNEGGQGGTNQSGQTRTQRSQSGTGTGGYARAGGYGQGGYGRAMGGNAQNQAASGAAMNFTLKEITVGITTDTQVEVLTGLTEGETVLIPVTVTTTKNQQQTGFGMGGMGGMGGGMTGGGFPGGGFSGTGTRSSSARTGGTGTSSGGGR